MREEISLKEVSMQERRGFIPLLLQADESEEIVNVYLYDGEMFAILLEGKVVGVTLFVRESPTIIELKNIALWSDYRGKGIGQAIMARSFDLYRQKNYRKMIVGTANSSIENIAFYQKAGFRMTGIKKDFFSHYPEPIYENGIRALDMVMFERKLEVK